MTHIHRAALLGVASIASICAAAGAASAEDIEINDSFGRIVWTEAATISVSVKNPGDLIETPKVSQNGQSFTVKGEMPRSYSCRSRFGDDMKIRLSRRGGYHSIDEYPLIRVSAPASATLKIENSMTAGRVGDLASADIEMDGCGDLEVGDVSGDLRASIDGSGDIKVGAVGGSADLEIDGSGDLDVGAVAGGGELSIDGSGNINVASLGAGGKLDIDGSGDIHAGRIEGHFEADIDGSGDIDVDAGSASSFSVTIGGSGDVSFDGDVANPSVRIMGSGDVWVASYHGNIEKDIDGSGDFDGDCAGSCS